MNQKERERQHKLYIKRRKHTTKQCAECGKVLEHGRQTYCINCLLKDYVSGDRGARLIAYKRLANRGYDSAMMLETAKERGLVV